MWPQTPLLVLWKCSILYTWDELVSFEGEQTGHCIKLCYQCPSTLFQNVRTGHIQQNLHPIIRCQGSKRWDCGTASVCFVVQRTKFSFMILSEWPFQAEKISKVTRKMPPKTLSYCGNVKTFVFKTHVLARLLLRTCHNSVAFVKKPCLFAQTSSQVGIQKSPSTNNNIKDGPSFLRGRVLIETFDHMMGAVDVLSDCYLLNIGFRQLLRSPSFLSW